jgi:hypothetical protein
MRQQMEGLLYQHGVDIVFSGHVSLSPHYSFTPTLSNGFITVKKELTCPFYLSKCSKKETILITVIKKQRTAFKF